MIDLLVLIGFTLGALVLVVYEELYSREFLDEKKKVFTTEDLSAYDGRNGVSYLACNGIVFDVSTMSQSSPLSIHRRFSGKDASLSLATMTFSDPELCEMSPSESRLSPTQMHHLQDWEKKYKEKCKIVGCMDYTLKPRIRGE